MVLMFGKVHFYIFITKQFLEFASYYSEVRVIMTFTDIHLLFI